MSASVDPTLFIVQSGAFIVRDSTQGPEEYSLSLWFDGGVRHLRWVGDASCVPQLCMGEIGFLEWGSQLNCAHNLYAICVQCIQIVCLYMHSAWISSVLFIFTRVSLCMSFVHFIPNSGYGCARTGNMSLVKRKREKWCVLGTSLHNYLHTSQCTTSHVLFATSFFSRHLNL